MEFVSSVGELEWLELELELGLEWFGEFGVVGVGFGVVWSWISCGLEVFWEPECVNLCVWRFGVGFRELF
jgi:hypothetical protein